MSHEADDDEGPGNSETSSLTEPSQGTDESVQAFREQAPFIAKYIPDCLHLAFLTMLVIFFWHLAFGVILAEFAPHLGTAYFKSMLLYMDSFLAFDSLFSKCATMVPTGNPAIAHVLMDFLFTAATCLKPACISFPSSILTWTSPLFTSQCPGAVLAWAGRAALWTVHSNATIS
tara:strand:- start:396 stop:917 length:522 start_codon:yes stop_codon:yes gene_type:complete